MSIPKLDGDEWGAKVIFEHMGQEVRVDIGVCLHFGDRYGYSYRWITAKNQSIPKHLEGFEEMFVDLQGIYDSHDFAVGDTISAQAVITPAGKLPANNSWTRKYAEDLHDLNAYKENIQRDVYENRGSEFELTPPTQTTYW